MFSNISTETTKSTILFPEIDNNLAFADYINQTRQIITKRRTDLEDANAETIIRANSPFEYAPTNPRNTKIGILLIHGLLDCPFTLREIGQFLQQQQCLVRSILLPGHGTRPEDLLYIQYQDWIETVKYGINTLRNNVDQIYLIGYSTGATLSVYEALRDSSIQGITLLSPAMKIKAPVDILTRWRQLTRWLSQQNQWVRRIPENDYVKYKSIAFNGVMQVARLCIVLRELLRKKKLSTPINLIVSREDETVSSH